MSTWNSLCWKTLIHYIFALRIARLFDFLLMTLDEFALLDFSSWRRFSFQESKGFGRKLLCQK